MSSEIFDVKEKVIVITGGYGTLGGSLAKQLIREKAKIVVLGRDKDKAITFAESLSKTDALGLETDVLNKETLIKVKETILQRWGKIDVLINAAGGNMKGATIAPNDSLFDISIEDFQKVTDLNLMGTVIPSLVFGEQMAKQKSGAIINVSSMAVPQVLTRVVGYSSAKAAMENFTRAIAPGFFIADQNRRLLTNEDGSLTERGETIIKNTPMKRFGEAKELSGAVLLLASEAGRFMTGTVIAIDGGFGAFSGV